MDKKMKGILGSVLVIGIAMTMIGASTVSWFEDTLSFEERDLTAGDVFFNWTDIKPGDYGEFTISLHLYDNPGYLFFNISNIFDDDNGINEPEDMVDGSMDGKDGTPDGDLDDYVYFWIWIDWGVTPGFGDDEESEGDNECQCSSGEPVIIHGHLKDISPNGETWNLSEIIKAYQPFGTIIPPYMEPCVTYYIAIAWFIPGEDVQEGEYFEPFNYYIPEDLPGAVEQMH